MTCAPIRPLIRGGNKACAHGVLLNVEPFRGVAGVGSQDVIKESLLPERDRIMVPPVEELGGPFLPFADEGAQRSALRCAAAKEMHMVRHHDVRTDAPAMERFALVPDLVHDVVGEVAREDRLTVIETHGDEIHRAMNPKPVESMKIPVSTAVAHGLHRRRGLCVIKQDVRRMGFGCSPGQ